MQYAVIFITAGNKKEADKIAVSLVQKRLAACVNIVSGIKSIFRWHGKVDNAKEILLIAKSAKSNFKKITKEVKRIHSYECPEIIALPIVAGNKDYLNWIQKETSRKKK